MAVVEDEDKYHSQDQIFTTPISSMTNDYTRDLINKFMAVEAAKTENQRRQRCNLPMPTLMPMPTVRHVQQQQLRFDTEKISVVEENYELSLGLSSNGRFGIDPNAKKIKRAVSIPESSMIPAAANRSGDDAENLIRTCSLPVVKPAENREEWLRRKEVQSQRRLEARRRKDEKRRQSRASRERSSSSRERGAGSEAGGENSNNNNNPVEQVGAPANGLIRTTSLVRRVGGIILTKEIDQVVPISPPTSGGSNGGSSSGNSVSDILPRQGATPMNTENSNSSNIAGPQNKTKVVSFLEGSSLSKNAGPQNQTKIGNFFEGASSARPQNIIMTASNPLDEMPSVTTKGGPNGRRIEGFLYKYGRGRRNVKIVCVCHGSFLTPAEFVRHAGGGDVTNPLQHIVVNRR